MSLDHIGITVPIADYPAAKEFYNTILTKLGNRIIMEFDPKTSNKPELGYGVGFGSKFPTFWIGAKDEKSSESKALKRTNGLKQSGFHLCFAANSQQSVRDWYSAAIAAGGIDNGPPGLRPYHRFYYGAFIIDQWGNNIEAANHFDWRTFINPKLAIGLGIAAVTIAAGYIAKYWV